MYNLLDIYAFLRMVKFEGLRQTTVTGSYSHQNVKKTYMSVHYCIIASVSKHRHMYMYVSIYKFSYKLINYIQWNL